MRNPLRVSILLVSMLAIAVVGCRNSGDGGGGSGGGRESVIGYSFPLEAGKYTVLGILQDEKDHVKALSNAEDALIKYPEIVCMVGLWAYNPPLILKAVKSAERLDTIKIVGFDEAEETLEGISQGHIHATVVQQPFLFGYRSVELLAAMARGQEVDIPDNKMFYVDHTVVKRDNVEEFITKVNDMRNGRGMPPKSLDDGYDTTEKVRVAFLTNSVDPFWQLAEQGALLAEPNFNADCKFYQPPNGQVAEQKEFIETMISDQRQGLAISPISPDNQVAMINKACDVMPVICQDSDAPNTKRRFYLGTSNYQAGRAAGKLVKEAVPDGGKIMIFVGKLEVLNAKQRSKGLIDELLGKEKE